MVKNLHEFAPIIADNILWLIHGKVGKKLLCRPKYLDVSGCAERLHSPIFHCSPLRTRFMKYDPSGIYEGLYLLDESDVQDYRLFTDTFLVNTETAVKAKMAVEELKNQGIDSQRLGVIGSVLWGKAIDGFSDINLAIQGDQEYVGYLNCCSKLFGFRFRGEDDWSNFYRQYGVKDISLESFIEMSKSNFQQGFFENIPFSLFHIRDVLPCYDKMSMCSTEADLTGEFCAIDSSPGYFPILGNFYTEGIKFKTVIWSRLWSPILPKHVRMRIIGKINGEQLIVSRNCDIKVLEVL